MPVNISIPLIETAKPDALESEETEFPAIDKVEATDAGLHCKPTIEEVVEVVAPEIVRFDIVFPIQLPTTGEAPVIPLSVPDKSAERVIEILVIVLLEIEEEV